MAIDEQLPEWQADLDALERRLASAFGGPLPGVDAHVLMAVRPRRFWAPGSVPDDSTVAATIFLVGRGQSGAPTGVLTLRTADLKRHGGQVSLPGGRVEPGETLEDAALREAHEELGVEARAIRILGRLSPLHVPVSRFVIHAFVGLLDPLPAWRHDRREVARVLDVPLAELAAPRNRMVETWSYEGQDYRVPYFAVAGEKVWGATAMILAEFLAVLGCPPAASLDPD